MASKAKKNPCEQSIWQNWGFRHAPCGAAGKFFEDGKWYCGRHAPSIKEAKSVAWRANFDAQMEADRLRRERESCLQAVALVTVAWEGELPEPVRQAVLRYREAKRAAEAAS
jgi:hypothetical protein